MRRYAAYALVLAIAYQTGLLKAMAQYMLQGSAFAFFYGISRKIEYDNTIKPH